MTFFSPTPRPCYVLEYVVREPQWRRPARRWWWPFPRARYEYYWLRRRVLLTPQAGQSLTAWLRDEPDLVRTLAGRGHPVRWLRLFWAPDPSPYFLNTNPIIDKEIL